MRLSLIRDVKDRRRMWSGTVHYMAEHLSLEGLEIDEVAPAFPTLTLALDKAGYAMTRLMQRRTLINRSETMSRVKGRILDQRLVTHKADAIFAPVSATLLPGLRSTLPVIYASDATLPLMFGYYDKFKAWTSAGKARAMAQERSALQRADLLLFPSDWAARSAIEDYNVDPARIRVTPFGANIDDAPTREQAIVPRKPGPIRLLWCGVDWARKGGDLTLTAVEDLRKRGIEVELTILGTTPDKPIPAALAPHVRVVPFLLKSDPEQYRLFKDLYLTSDIFVLPTRAECYGVVFCEAAAYGIPSVTLDTGGTSAVVRHGETGLVLPLNSTAGKLADSIAQIVTDPGKLEQMGRAARDDYETRLNWAAWAADVVPSIRALARP